MSKAKLRSVSTKFWTDPFVEDLTVSEKLLFLYLITNDRNNMLGIYEISLKKISFETGIDKATIEKAFKRFERLNKVKYSNNYVTLFNFIKNQSYNQNMKVSAVNLYNDLPEHAKIEGVTVDEYNPSKAFESLCKGFGILRKIEIEEESEIEIENEDEIEAHKKKQIPSFDEFLTYARTLDPWSEDYKFSLEAKYDQWKENKWKDGYNKPIKNWKTKIKNTLPHLQRTKPKEGQVVMRSYKKDQLL